MLRGNFNSKQQQSSSPSSSRILQSKNDDTCPELDVVHACRGTSISKLYTGKYRPYDGVCDGFASDLPIYKSLSKNRYIQPYGLDEGRMTRWRIVSYQNYVDTTTCRKEDANIYFLEFTSNGQPYNEYKSDILCFDEQFSGGYTPSEIKIECNWKAKNSANKSNGGSDNMKEGGNGWIAIVIVVLVLLAFGGGAYFYWACRRKQQSTKPSDSKAEMAQTTGTKEKEKDAASQPNEKCHMATSGHRTDEDLSSSDEEEKTSQKETAISSTSRRRHPATATPIYQGPTRKDEVARSTRATRANNGKKEIPKRTSNSPAGGSPTTADPIPQEIQDMEAELDKLFQETVDPKPDLGPKSIKLEGEEHDNSMREGTEDATNQGSQLPERKRSNSFERGQASKHHKQRTQSRETSLERTSRAIPTRRDRSMERDKATDYANHKSKSIRHKGDTALVASSEHIPRSGGRPKSMRHKDNKSLGTSSEHGPRSGRRGRLKSLSASSEHVPRYRGRGDKLLGASSEHIPRYRGQGDKSLEASSEHVPRSRGQGDKSLLGASSEHVPRSRCQGNRSLGTSSEHIPKSRGRPKESGKAEGFANHKPKSKRNRGEKSSANRSTPADIDEMVNSMHGLFEEATKLGSQLPERKGRNRSKERSKANDFASQSCEIASTQRIDPTHPETPRSIPQD